MLATPLFRVPPFPRSGRYELMRPGIEKPVPIGDRQVSELIALARELRVGSTYWASQPSLPTEPYALVRVRDPEERSGLLRSIGAEQSILLWIGATDRAIPSPGEKIWIIAGCCDPWHLMGGAELVYVDADDELALIASIAGIPVRCIGRGGFESLDKESAGQSALEEVFRARVIDPNEFVTPFNKATITPAAAIELCGFWRSMIDSNRGLGSALGFASWKRATVEPLLWAGSAPVLFASQVREGDQDASVAVWKSRVDKRQLDALERSGSRLIEVEDGFIRSVGLGADCVPPLSIVVDHRGIYFDPGQESDLEQLLQEGDFSEDLLARARQLRELIVGLGFGKYEVAKPAAERAGIQPGSILVPGQVEDDRSVQQGGGDIQGNLELLRRVRANSPNAHIIYKPHPDVEAGHRLGRIADDTCLTLADEIVRDQPISAMFHRVEAVHVNTSLAGFEALLRGKQVTTYGVPFYAGWGLTRDLGQVPHRRTARRTLDELVAAALLVYPRYVDPLTGLPCPPEVLIQRLSTGSGKRGEGLLVPLRRLQGRLKRAMASIRSMLA